VRLICDQLLQFCDGHPTGLLAAADYVKWQCMQVIYAADGCRHVRDCPLALHR
jgi:hypothetical protein